MKKKIFALTLVLGIGGLALTAHRLLSFQLDAAGLKALAKAWIVHRGEELGIPEDSRTKVAGVAVRGIDGVTPVLSGIYQTLGEIQKDQQGAGTPQLTAHLDLLFGKMGNLIDVKDAVMADARKSLTARERATLVAKVANRFADNGALTPTEMENLFDALRATHKARVRSFLHMDAQQAAKIDGTMQAFVDQRKQVRASRHALVQKIKAAVHDNAADGVVAGLMKEWDALNDKGSAIGRAQLAAARKALSDGDLGKLASRAHDRIEKGLWLVALIQKCRPVM
jgi:hypothetical protein